MGINKIILLACIFMEATMAYKIPYGIPREEKISDKRYLNERSEENTEDLPELSSRTVESSDDEEDSFINDMLRIDERYSKGSSTVESSDDEEDSQMDDMLQTSQNYGKSSSTVKSQDDEEDSILDDMLQVDQSYRESASSMESSDDEDDSSIDDMLRTDESYRKGSRKLKPTDDKVDSLRDDMLQTDEHDKKRPRLSHHPASVALDENQLEPYCHTKEYSIGNDVIPPWVYEDDKYYINFYRPQKEVKCNPPSGSNSIMIDDVRHEICNAVSNCFQDKKSVEVRFYSILPFEMKVKTYLLDVGCICLRTENIGGR